MGSPNPHRPHGATVSPPGNKPRPRPPSGSSSTQPPNNHTPPPASRRPRLGPALSALACPTPGCGRTPPQPLGCHRWVPPTPQSSSPPFPPTLFLPSGLCSGPAPAEAPPPRPRPRARRPPPAAGPRGSPPQSAPLAPRPHLRPRAPPRPGDHPPLAEAGRSAPGSLGGLGPSPPPPRGDSRRTARAPGRASSQAARRAAGASGTRCEPGRQAVRRAVPCGNSSPATRLAPAAPAWVRRVCSPRGSR